MYRRVDIGLSAFFLLLGVGVLVGAGQITQLQPPFEDVVGARGFAYVVGVFTALCAVLLLGLQLAQLQRGELSFGDAEDPDVTGDDPRYPASSRRAFMMIALTAAYALLLSPLGYLISTVSYIALGMFVMGSRNVLSLFVFPGMFAVGSYLLFDTLLSVRLPPGVLAPILRLVGLE